MSRQRDKGTRAESALVEYLRGRGHDAKRRALAGAADQGDVDWLPWLAVEVKNVRSPAYRAWLREAEAERINAGASTGIVVHKPHGVSIDSQSDWHVIMSLDTFVSLIENFTRD